MGEFVLFVSPTANSIGLCRIILKNLQDINAAGWSIKICKVLLDDKKQRANLRGLGISSTPCLVIPGSEKRIEGVQPIITVLRGITRDNNNDDILPGEYYSRGGHRGDQTIYHEGDDMSAYLAAVAMEDMNSDGARDSVGEDDWKPDEALLAAARAREEFKKSRQPANYQEPRDTMDEHIDTLEPRAKNNMPGAYDGQPTQSLRGMMDEDDADTAFLLDALNLN